MGQFDASRTVVREALALLVQEGQIERTRGQGTSRIVDYDFFDVTVPRTTLDEAAYSKLVAAAAPVVLHRGWSQVSAPLARRLTNVEPDDRCYVVEYVLTRRGAPKAVFTNYLRRAEGLLVEQVLLDSDWYSALRVAGISVRSQSSTFQVRLADSETAGILEIDLGTAVLDHQQTLTDDRGEVFNVSFGSLRSDVRLMSR